MLVTTTDRIDLHAEYHGEIPRPGDPARVLWGLGDLHEARGFAGLILFDDLRHLSELRLGRFHIIHHVAEAVEIPRQQRIVHGMEHNEPQPSSPGALQPVYIHLLVQYAVEARPVLVFWIPRAGVSRRFE